MSLFNFPDTFVYFLFVWKTKIFFSSFHSQCYGCFQYLYTQRAFRELHTQSSYSLWGTAERAVSWAQSVQIYTSTRRTRETFKFFSLEEVKKSSAEIIGKISKICCVLRFQWFECWPGRGGGGWGCDRQFTILIVDVLRIVHAYLL